MTERTVTIGLIVRNGAAHLPAAIASLLAQTHDDLELTVWDNASEDDTREIAGRFAADDRRVRLVRHPRDVGAIANFRAALEHARTPYFCWAACDDLREPQFLERLIAALERHPRAGLASCGVRDMTPGGRVLDERHETRALGKSLTGPPDIRVRGYLRTTPCTPIYGVFRTPAAHRLLPVLRRLAVPATPPPFGGDLVTLLDFVARHDVIAIDDPLLLFRKGGASHRVDAYADLRAYVADVRRFCRACWRATRLPGVSATRQCRVDAALLGAWARHGCSPGVRRMTAHYVRRAWPLAAAVGARTTAHGHAAFRRLGRRARTLPAGSRVVLFGGGKHTSRALPAIRHALGGRITVAGICDDAVAGDRAMDPIDGVCIASPAELERFEATLILVSSDAYEGRLARRAVEVTRGALPVWCLYDTRLEGRV